MQLLPLLPLWRFHAGYGAAAGLMRGFCCLIFASDDALLFFFA
jgi:hypothetical protein